MIPTTLKVGQLPLAAVATLGNTTFMGRNRDQLGFDHFYEAGLAIQFDTATVSKKLANLRVGYNFIFGPDVSGWGLIVGYNY